MILIVLFFERWFPRFFDLIGLAFYLPKPDPKIVFCSKDMDERSKVRRISQFN